MVVKILIRRGIASTFIICSDRIGKKSFFDLKHKKTGFFSDMNFRKIPSKKLTPDSDSTGKTTYRKKINSKVSMGIFEILDLKHRQL